MSRKRVLKKHLRLATISLIAFCISLITSLVIFVETNEAEDSDTYPIAGFTSYVKVMWASDYDIEVVEEEIVTEQSPAYTEADYENLAKLIELEAGNLSWEGKLAVGSVAINRMTNGESWQTGDTIYEVWARKGQYSTFKNRNKAKPSEESYEASEYLLTYGSTLPEYVLYHRCGGRCVKGSTLYMIIEGEYFSY